MKKFNKIKIILFLIMAIVSPLSLAKTEPSQALQSWIKEEMEKYHIVGASIAVIKNYNIEWIATFGTANKAENKPVTPSTLFQAASISKPITAVATVKAFNEKKRSLDTNINNILTSWKIPASDYTRNKPITARLLLSHSAGITGFREKGYEVGSKIPTLIEILNGKNPANTPPIVVIRTPGTQYEYSPASYTIIQQTLIDLYHQPFADIMNKLILSPLQMNHSTFQEPLPQSYYANIALPYLPDGKLMPHAPLAFPTAAAGGLWSTPEDLAKFVIAIQHVLAGQTVAGITPKMIKEIMQPGVSSNMGLGFEVNINQYGELASKGNYFRHGGFNSGYLSMMVGSKTGGNGIVIMTNSGPYMQDPVVVQYDFLATVIKKVAEVEQWK